MLQPSPVKLRTSAPSIDRTQPHLQIEDALASARRIWLRGRLQPIRGEPANLHVQTRVSGHVFTADVPLRPDGRFEALYTADLPSARRGWRMTRNQVTWGEFQTEKCGLALLPPVEARQACLILLPEAYTCSSHGPQELIRRETNSLLTLTVRRLADQRAPRTTFYYLGRVPRDGGASPNEVALATTTVGWPQGPIVLLPEVDALRAFTEGIDRLRWLLAEHLEVVILNREPGLTGKLPTVLASREDRAPVTRFMDANEEPCGVLAAETVLRPAVTSRVHRPTRAGLVPRHPIVFCHGLLAFSTIHMQVPEDLNCFAPMREFLRARGFDVLFPQVAPTASVADRAEELRDQIRRWTDEPVNLIAHSMGGLDARYLITHLDMARRVCSLTTIATPHRGTYLADWFLANYRQRIPLLLALEALGLNVDGFGDCRPSACAAFNARTPDRPEVKYFSFGGAVPASKVSPALRRGWSLLMPLEGANDGLVSLQSARWGEYLGTIAADHFAQTPDMVFTRSGEDFDALGFYTRLVQDLARRGF